MNETSQKIQNLNDMFRQSILTDPSVLHGRVIMTRGVQALFEERVRDLLQEVSSYHTFSKDNDPYGEHDFGGLTYESERVFWKIDYYDRDLKFGSEDPSNPDMTTRVLTIMLASEY
jgi:hypothetical protein